MTQNLKEIENQDATEQLRQTPEQTEQEQPSADEEQTHHSEHHHGEHHHSEHHHSEHHHSEHRHSKHHHSKHRRKKSSKRSPGRKIKSFFKKKKKIWIPIASVLAIALIVGVLLGAVELISRFSAEPENQTAQGTEGVVILATSVLEQEQSLVGSAVYTIMENQVHTTPAHVILKDYLDSDVRLDVSMPVKLSFYLENKPADYTVQSITVEVADNSSFTDAWQYPLQPTDQELQLINLKTGTQYYYRVNIQFTNGVTAMTGSSFKTKASPRVLTVSGAYNVRDIGGWVTAEGKQVRQGLLLRGTELDGAVETKYTLTEEGKTMLVDRLGVRTEMDLRWSAPSAKCRSMLGETVTHNYYNIAPYTDIFAAGNEEAVRQIFSDLAKPESYPVYMHCTYGRDRTGTICCLLEALLGVQEGDLWRDYQLSALEKKYLDSSFERFMVALQEMEGQTLREKTENYLLSIGVTQQEIASIREIFLGES